MGVYISFYNSKSFKKKFIYEKFNSKDFQFRVGMTRGQTDWVWNKLGLNQVEINNSGKFTLFLICPVPWFIFSRFFLNVNEDGQTVSVITIDDA